MVGIHVFYECKQRHGWCAFAHHDDAGGSACDSVNVIVGLA